MACVVVVGTQWGDEGKGKIVDLLTDRVNLVVRYQGGNNAGHTIKFQDKSFILRLVPSGILRQAISVIGNGLVVDPQSLLEEIAGLKGLGVDVENYLRVSATAHLVMPHHKIFDKLREQQKGDKKIGTTGRGIGPAYADKVSRSGIRIIELSDAAHFRRRLEEILPEKNCLLRHYYNYGEELSLERILNEYLNYYEQIKHYLCDSVLLINQAIEKGKNVLFEGAQGTFLDIDHGTYPYVTSSNTGAGGVCTGAGVGPGKITNVIGIAKAYTTRVGSGPFPTEQDNELGEFIRKEGVEFGSVTGRPRRCGWFDAVLVRHAVRLNGINTLTVTKMDVLDKLPTLQIAVGYRNARGEVFSEFPVSGLEGLTPIYEEMPGWNCSTQGITDYNKLPKATVAYLERLSELVNTPISIISTGPKREETILRNIDSLWR